MRWLVSGDTHRADFHRFDALDKNEKINVIILGDFGVNYMLDNSDDDLKRALARKYPQITWYAVRGNHEQRPEFVVGMELEYDGEVNGEVYWQPAFPHIRYFKDGGEYLINGYHTLVVGGAYSVDKNYRLACGRGWFDQEQLSYQERTNIMANSLGRTFDLVLAHTCPYQWQPFGLFLTGIDQSTVDNTMEYWLQELVENIKFKRFAFGHFHDNRNMPNEKAVMLFRDIVDLDTLVERGLVNDR